MRGRLVVPGLLVVVFAGCHALHATKGPPGGSGSGGGAGTRGGGADGDAGGGSGSDGGAMLVDGGGADGAIATGTPGLGATPHAGGVTFRVWAPDALRV